MVPHSSNGVAGGPGRLTGAASGASHVDCRTASEPSAAVSVAARTSGTSDAAAPETADCA